jgi:hypothetical protein
MKHKLIVDLLIFIGRRNHSVKIKSRQIINSIFPPFQPQKFNGKAKDRTDQSQKIKN